MDRRPEIAEARLIDLRLAGLSKRAVVSIRSLLSSQYQRLPRRVRMAVLVRRQAAIWRQAGIVFVHIPKAAGTSMNLALYGRFMGHPEAQDIHTWAPRDVASLPCFAIARNPWDRLVSAYRFVKRGGGVGGDFQIHAIKDYEQYHAAEFETFERFVKDWLSTKEIDKLDLAFQPQHRFVCDRRGKVLVDHVGRLENIRPTIDFIRDHTGRTPEMASANRSGEQVDYRQYYTPSLVRSVGDIYQRDIALFGYDF